MPVEGRGWEVGVGHERDVGDEAVACCQMELYIALGIIPQSTREESHKARVLERGNHFGRSLEKKKKKKKKGKMNCVSFDGHVSCCVEMLIEIHIQSG